MQKDLGQKIKDVRTSKGLTLKDISEKTGLSQGFLSLAERGLTSITIVSLQNIAEALGVDIKYFLDFPGKHERRVARSYEHQATRMEQSRFIYSSLASDLPGGVLDPMIITILPGETKEEPAQLLTHAGEEFCFVLEGILTYFIGEKEYELYPGDSVHILSSEPHNYGNFTNKLVKVLFLITPKVFQ